MAEDDRSVSAAVTSVVLGISPYSDGSGHRIEVTIDPSETDDAISLHQYSDQWIRFSVREWGLMRQKIDEALAYLDRTGVSIMQGSRDE